MSKRKASEDLGAVANKKLLTGDDSFHDGRLRDEKYDKDNEDFDDSTSQTPSADTNNPETAYTETTSVSTRSRKFPSDLKTIKCTYPNCNKTFNRPARLAAHLRSHTDDRPFKCTYSGCDKSYREEKHLRQHIKGSHTVERSYVCETEGCGKSFLTATRLRRHQDVHAGQERFRCRDYPPCNQTFRKHSTLQRHIRAEHQGGPAYLCAEEGCGAGFDSQGALRNHTKREHAEPKFWCEECGQLEGDEEEGDAGVKKSQKVGFATLHQLQTHIRKEHLSCVFCDRKCKGQAELEKHVEMYHSGIPVEARKTIACTWEGCGKKFTKKNNLNAHIRSAHQGFRFVCGEVDLRGNGIAGELATWDNDQGCGVGFATKASLEHHIRHVHLGIERQPPLPTAKKNGPENVIDDIAGTKRNISCAAPNCTERFIRHHDLQRHLQRHHQSLAETSTAGLDPEEANVLRLAEASDAMISGIDDIPSSSPPPQAQDQERIMPDLPFLGLRQPVAMRPDPHTLANMQAETSYSFSGAAMEYGDPAEGDDDVFWIGADRGMFSDFPGGDEMQKLEVERSEETWRHEEADMRALIDGDCEPFVDPALQELSGV